MYNIIQNCFKLNILKLSMHHTDNLLVNNNNGAINLTQFVPLDLSGGGDDHDKNVAARGDDSAIRSKERI